MYFPKILHESIVKDYHFGTALVLLTNFKSKKPRNYSEKLFPLLNTLPFNALFPDISVLLLCFILLQ